MATPSEQSDDRETPSHYNEFAFCFLFLKKFGTYLSLPKTTLLSLESFLSRESLNPNDPITSIHYQLVSMATRRPVTHDNWPYIMGRMAYLAHIIDDGDMEYEEYTIKERLVLLKFLCELQFDRNQSFKNHLSKIPDGDLTWRDSPIGLDKEGKRYWLLEDEDFDIRVYSEFKYLEYPFDHPQWTLVCRSLDQLNQLADELSNVDDKNKEATSPPAAEESSLMEEDTKPDVDSKQKKRTLGKKRRSSGRRKPREQTASAAAAKATIGGCIVCRKDTYYSKMLLCDGCDRECHTFCQYPIVWEIPDTEWFCPTCRQLKLSEKLVGIHDKMTQAKILYEQSIEDKRRKIKRLARGGVLVENIIQKEEEAIDDEAPRRSSRARKKIDYAELNDVNIKTISFMPSSHSSHVYSSNTALTTRNHASYTSTGTAAVTARHMRNTRRNRITYLAAQQEEEQLKKNSVMDGASHPITNIQEEVEEEESTCSRVQGYDRAFLSRYKTTSSEANTVGSDLPTEKDVPNETGTCNSASTVFTGTPVQPSHPLVCSLPLTMVKPVEQVSSEQTALFPLRLDSNTAPPISMPSTIPPVHPGLIETPPTGIVPSTCSTVVNSSDYKSSNSCQDHVSTITPKVPCLNNMATISNAPSEEHCASQQPLLQSVVKDKENKKNECLLTSISNNSSGQHESAPPFLVLAKGDEPMPTANTDHRNNLISTPPLSLPTTARGTLAATTDYYNNLKSARPLPLLTTAREDELTPTANTDYLKSAPSISLPTTAKGDEPVTIASNDYHKSTPPLPPSRSRGDELTPAANIDCHNNLKSAPLSGTSEDSKPTSF